MRRKTLSPRRLVTSALFSAAFVAVMAVAVPQSASAAAVPDVCMSYIVGAHG
jgi:hypothetical protein